MIYAHPYETTWMQLSAGMQALRVAMSVKIFSVSFSLNDSEIHMNICTCTKHESYPIRRDAAQTEKNTELKAQGARDLSFWVQVCILGLCVVTNMVDIL